MEFKYIYIIILLLPIISAQSTFFDNPDEVFILSELEDVEVIDTGGGASSPYSYYSQCYNLINNTCKYVAVYDSPCPTNYFNTLELCEESLIIYEPTVCDKIIENIKSIFNITKTETEDIPEEIKNNYIGICILIVILCLIFYYFPINNK